MTIPELKELNEQIPENAPEQQDTFYHGVGAGQKEIPFAATGCNSAPFA